MGERQVRYKQVGGRMGRVMEIGKMQFSRRTVEAMVGNIIVRESSAVGVRELGGGGGGGEQKSHTR